MKKTIKDIDFLDEDPTDELPVLNEAALARIASVEASSLGDAAEDTGKHPTVQLESLSATRRQKTLDSSSPTLQGLEGELKALQQRWHAIEDELHDRDIEVAKREESLRARAAAIEALEEELQAANRARREPPAAPARQSTSRLKRLSRAIA